MKKAKVKKSCVSTESKTTLAFSLASKSPFHFRFIINGISTKFKFFKGTLLTKNEMVSAAVI